MSNVISCPTCGGPARTSRTQNNASGEPGLPLTAVTDAAKSEKIAQLKETVQNQKQRLDAAKQRIRDLEKTLHQSSAQIALRTRRAD